MNVPSPLPQNPVDPQVEGVIKLAIMAVGGQGGGVLTGWIESLARAQGYACQATSVAGVAQRTGATIYYIEMAPAGSAEPVFSLAPSAGDVDILIAAELMEAGRAIMRGFVTPDKTTLIASSHRALAVSEKMAPGDGIADGDEVLAAAGIAAERLICFDMEAIAVDNDSAISAALFGALAASEALPFPRQAFVDAIRRSGKSVAPSLACFRAASAAGADAPPPEPEPQAVREGVTVPAGQQAGWQALQEQVATLPEPAQPMAQAGLRKVVDFMDAVYGGDYLAHLQAVAARDSTAHGFELTGEAAKYLANAMAYDDVIRVADLKTRASRTARIRDEMNVGDGHVMHLTEFMHPRADEVDGMLPAGLGRRIEASPRAMRWLTRAFCRGRRLRSDGLMSFLTLYALGGLRGYRRRTLRHSIEQAHLERWLGLAIETAQKDYALGVEILRCRRLIKGYSDTHARGLSKFDRVIGALSLIEGRPDASDWLRRLREAALQDPEGVALDGAIRTIATL